jgi:hypothetical protein
MAGDVPNPTLSATKSFLVPLLKVQLAFDGKGQASAAVIDCCDEVLRRTQSKRAMADGFDLALGGGWNAAKLPKV